jgi:hypothetical protein
MFMAMWNPLAAVSQPQPSAAWQAPTENERKLYEAKARGDWVGYFDVLADCDLFISMSRWEADGPDTGPPMSYWSPVVGRWCEVVLTEGILPAPAPDPVFGLISLGDFAESWGNDERWLAVNPGTPCEAYFPPNPGLWKAHADRGKGSDVQRGTLRTLWVGAPLQGPVAHGLGCGALMNVANGALWNAMGTHGNGYFLERKSLEQWWGVTDRSSWQGALDGLLKGRGVRGPWEFVLEVRSSLSQQFGGQVDPALWRETAEKALLHSAAERGGTVSDAEVAGVKQLIGRITRYEGRFRADGILAANGRVRSALAWDYGRASCMARWGVGARFTDIPEAEQAVLHVSRLSKMTYNSWEEFAAGYILGRCLHFDDEQFGHWYTQMLHAHQVLATHAESPWRTVSWA